MAKYDGLIIPRSYNDYINKSDPLGVSQALQLTGVMDAAPTESSNKAARSGGIYNAIDAVKPVNTVALNNLHSVTSNAVANLLNTYVIDIPYTIPANSSYIATYNADTSEYKTILAVIENTGDNKVIPFKSEYNNGSVSIGLQNFNAIDLTLSIKIRLLRKHV